MSPIQEFTPIVRVPARARGGGGVVGVGVGRVPPIGVSNLFGVSLLTHRGSRFHKDLY